MAAAAPDTAAGLAAAIERAAAAGELLDRLERAIATAAKLRTEPHRLTYGTAEVAAALSIGERTARGLIAAGDIPSRYIGRRRVVLRRDLEDYVASLPRTPERRRP